MVCRARQSNLITRNFQVERYYNRLQNDVLLTPTKPRQARRTRPKQERARQQHPLSARPQRQPTAQHHMVTCPDFRNSMSAQLYEPMRPLTQKFLPRNGRYYQHLCLSHRQLDLITQPVVSTHRATFTSNIFLHPMQSFKRVSVPLGTELD